MTTQHLSDEAVAAFADGVLRGHVHDRAARHTATCAECTHAVRVQREAVLALRSATAPALPSSLASRLRTVPQTTPISLIPTVLDGDGTPMLVTGLPTPRVGLPSSGALSMAALVAPQRTPRTRRTHRINPVATTVAVVALTGALSVGAVAARTGDAPEDPSSNQIVRQLNRTNEVPEPVISPVGLLRRGHG